MRWDVEVILDMLGSGMTPEQIIEEHNELEKEDYCVFKYARHSVSGMAFPIEALNEISL